MFILFNVEKNVQLKYRVFRRRHGVFYWQENNSSKQRIRSVFAAASSG